MKVDIMTHKKLLQIELNEFDPEFLNEQAGKLGLENIQHFLRFQRSQTITDDKIEHQGLDPWVQWVNVHSGVPSRVHGIKRLGDTQKQKHPQIWEAVAKRGKRWAVWGVMNAPMGNKKGGELFMPDPWSFEETAYPENLNYLLSLPRYMARNYMETSKAEFTKRFMHFIRYYAPPSHWPTILKFSKKVMASSFSPGLNLHSLTTLLDYLGALEFVRYRKNKSPEFSVIFLNHIAHLQHQFWTTGDGLHPEMKFGLEICDLIMGLLLQTNSENEAIVIMNGLKQKNVHGQGFYVYRQINPEASFRQLTANDNLSIEQCMTNDAHLIFKTQVDADEAFSRLENMHLSDQSKLFFVERVSQKHIFAQLNIEHEVAHETFILVDDTKHKFYDLFDLVCERTGAHIPNGDIFAKGIEFPNRFYNHDVYKHTLNYFDTP